MATNISKLYPLGSPQEHILMCDKHDLSIDMVCEDCLEFICSKCAKTDHKDHDWNTIPTAATLRRRQLKETISNTKERTVKEMDKKIQKAAKQIEASQTLCESEVSNLRKHYGKITAKLEELKNRHEKSLRDNLTSKTSELCKGKLDLEMKKTKVVKLVKFLEENHTVMSDFSLIDTLRDMTILTSSNVTNVGHLMRYRGGIINEEILESMLGHTFDLDSITLSAAGPKPFQFGYKPIYVLEAVTEDAYIVGELGSEYMYIEKINMRSKKREKLNINVNAVCVTDNGDVYVTNENYKSVDRVLPTGSVSTAFSTDPLVPEGICQSTEKKLLITLRDDAKKRYQLESRSRRLVRHVTYSGDVIKEYEYEADGRTRLFTVPYKVKQNSNTDICVVNWTSDETSELMILANSGLVRSVYRGQDPTKICLLVDVVFDTHCNLIVSDVTYSKVHLLSPGGEFLKYLLNESEVSHPMSLSLYKSTLWVGDIDGRLSAFCYQT